MENILLFFNLFALLALNAAWVIGFYNATRYETHAIQSVEDETKMIAWRIKYFANKYLGPFWSKPICDCPPCMASIHSLWYFLFFEFNPMNIIMWVFYVFVLSGILKLIITKFQL